MKELYCLLLFSANFMQCLTRAEEKFVSCQKIEGAIFWFTGGDGD